MLRDGTCLDVKMSFIEGSLKRLYWDEQDPRSMQGQEPQPAAPAHVSASPPVFSSPPPSTAASTVPSAASLPEGLDLSNLGTLAAMLGVSAPAAELVPTASGEPDVVEVCWSPLFLLSPVRTHGMNAGRMQNCTFTGVQGTCHGLNRVCGC